VIQCVSGTSGWSKRSNSSCHCLPSSESSTEVETDVNREATASPKTPKQWHSILKIVTRVEWHSRSKIPTVTRLRPGRQFLRKAVPCEIVRRVHRKDKADCDRRPRRLPVARFGGLVIETAIRTKRLFGSASLLPEQTGPARDFRAGTVARGRNFAVRPWFGRQQRDQTSRRLGTEVKSLLLVGRSH
jgi:hypothetical protein